MSFPWQISLLTFLLFCFPLLHAEAFAPETTHAGLTEQVLEFYDNYFQHSFSQNEKEFVITGAIEEDMPADRALNHFYDPVRNIGLHGQRSSKEWLLRSVDNRWSWPNSIVAYARGDTESALVGLGHALHLIEDAGVPDHTRNDPHIGDGAKGLDTGASPFELWTSGAKNRTTLAGLGRSLIEARVEPVLKNTLDEYFDFLAGYSNGNFFSRDTILSLNFYPKPEIVSFDSKYGYAVDSISREKFKIVVSEEPKSGNRILKLVDKDDNSVLEEYFARLSKQIIRTGVGVVDLFLKEAEAARKEFLRAQQEQIQQEQRAAESKVQALQNGGMGLRIVYALGDFWNSVQQPTQHAATIVKQGVSYASVSSYQEAKNLAGFGVYGARFIGTAADAAVSVLNEAVDTAIKTGVTFAQESVVAAASAATTAASTPVADTPLFAYEIIAPVVMTPAPAPIIEPSITPSSPIGYREIGPLPETASGSSGLNPASPVVESVASPVVSETMDTTPPDAVADLVATPTDWQSMTLSWTAPADAIACVLAYSGESMSEAQWDAYTKSESSLVSGLAAQKTYYSAVRCKDAAGNWSALSNEASATTPRRPITPPDHVVISEVFIDMPDADTGEFIELYNPTDREIDLPSYSLQYLSGSAESFDSVEKKNFTIDAKIAPHGFYLIGTGEHAAAKSVDMRWSQALNNTGATILLMNSHLAATGFDDATIIDRVQYGTSPSVIDTQGFVVLPPVGSSIERRAIVDGLCVAAQEDAEFTGNGCDTNAVADDFFVRSTPKPQSTNNLPEPREAPAWAEASATFATYVADDASAHTTPQIRFSYPVAHDARGSDGVRYVITDVSAIEVPIPVVDQVALTTALDEINEIGREYAFNLEVFDADGLAGKAIRQTLIVPGYFASMHWRKDGENKSPNKSQQYVIEFGFDRYPFVPISTMFNGAPYPGWHVAVPYYNHEAEKTPSFNSTNEGKIWGSAGNPYGIRADYWSCSSYSNQSIVFPDTAAQCSRLVGGVRGLAYDWEVLKANDFKKAIVYVWGSSFKTPPTVGTDYLTFAFYRSVVGSNDSIFLIAVDKTKYYLEE